MSTTTPDAPKKTNRSASTCSPIAAARRRSLPATGTMRSPSGSSKRSTRWGSSQRRDQAVGDWLFEQEPGVLPWRRARLQHRSWTDAVGRHGRHACQSQAPGDRHERGRRYGSDRHRAVRALDAAEPANRLHHRRQRLLRPYEGTVFADRGSGFESQERDCQRAASNRHVCARDRARRLVRRALVLGRQEQLLSILKAALSHRGTAMIDVLSPCVTFNDHDGSTKSYAYAKDHDEVLGEVSFVPFSKTSASSTMPATPRRSPCTTDRSSF